MEEVAPGIMHWTALHPHIKVDVHSYAVRGPGVLIDPMLPPVGGAEALTEFDPQMVVLTNRHHTRDAAAVAERFGIPVRVSAPGVEEASSHVLVTPFDWNEQLAPGVTALDVGAICPDESAIHFADARALACADGVVRFTGELGFVPDFLLGDDPEAVKDGLRTAYRRLLDLEFDHLLLAHGAPIVDNGREALAAFVGDR